MRAVVAHLGQRTSDRIVDLTCAGLAPPRNYRRTG
jgi:hypothetical protein